MTSAGKKRTSTEAGEVDHSKTTRGSKAAKTEGNASPKAKSPNGKSGGKGGKRGVKANLTPSQFKSIALPLHVNITHTPPVITEDDTSVPAATADPGFIGSSTLIPTMFTTGSYGWKGNKRTAIEIPNPEGGEKEKVHVMITMNVTVMGSKQVKENGDDEDAAGPTEDGEPDERPVEEKAEDEE